MKTSTLALITSAAMALSIPNFHNGKGWNMERENELQIKEAISPTPSTDIEEGIKYSTISGNLNVVDPKDSEVMFFPRDSPEAEESNAPQESEESEDDEDWDDEDWDLILIPRQFSDEQESGEPKVSPESEESEDDDDWDDDDSDLILVPRQFSDAQESGKPNLPQESEDDDDSDLILIPRDFTDTHNEIKEKLIASETELISIAQKVYSEKKLDVSRYFALKSEIIQLRDVLRSSNDETRKETKAVFKKVVSAYRKLNQRIIDVCDGGRYDPYGYCSTFSADTFFAYARGTGLAFDFLLNKFKDDRYIKDPVKSVSYVPQLVYTYKTTAKSFMELQKVGLNRWLVGNTERAMAMFESVTRDFKKLTAILQQYNLV